MTSTPNNACTNLFSELGSVGHQVVDLQGEGLRFGLRLAVLLLQARLFRLQGG
jgi:hypothetical protein